MRDCLAVLLNIRSSMTDPHEAHTLLLHAAAGISTFCTNTNSAQPASQSCLYQQRPICSICHPLTAQNYVCLISCTHIHSTEHHAPHFNYRTIFVSPQKWSGHVARLIMLYGNTAHPGWGLTCCICVQYKTTIALMYKPSVQMCVHDEEQGHNQTRYCTEAVKGLLPTLLYPLCFRDLTEILQL